MFVTQSIREQFPEAWIRNGHPFDAAVALGLNPGDAWAIAQQLANDPEIIEARNALIQCHGLEYFLPTRIEFAQEILVQARRSKDEAAKERFYRLYGELRGYSDDPVGNSGKSINIVVRRSTIPHKTIETKAVN